MKGLYFVAFSFLFATQPLLAFFQEVNSYEDKAHSEIVSFEEKVKRLEQELGLKTPPPRLTLSFFGDFLYFKAALDGVAYATTVVEVRNADGSLGFNRFKTRTVHFEYDPGFSIGAGIGLPYDHWDISTRWLRFHASGSDQARGSSSLEIGKRIIFDSIGMLESLLTPPRKAKANCQIDFDIVDLVFGRRFLWSSYFEFKPYAGLRGLWVDIDWDIAFTTPVVTPSSLDQTSAFLDVDNDFDAIGFIGGFESKWSFYKGLGLFSYATASLVYGRSSERTKEEFFLVPAFENTTFKQTLKARNSTHSVKAVFDLALGLKWEIHFKKHYGFLVRAGYELFYLPSITQKTVIQATRVRDRSDLSFQGLIVGARFDF